MTLETGQEWQRGARLGPSHGFRQGVMAAQTRVVTAVVLVVGVTTGGSNRPCRALEGVAEGITDAVDAAGETEEARTPPWVVCERLIDQSPDFMRRESLVGGAGLEGSLCQ